MAVTSANPGEGKTMVAANLAVSMARAGRRVLLIDADLRRPQLHDMFSVARSPGLSDVMTDEVKPSGALRETAIAGLFILSAGTDMASSTDVLDAERLPGLIDGFSRVFDVIVLDCPPVLGVADASIVANAASSVLFVAGSVGRPRSAGCGRLASFRQLAGGWRRAEQREADHRSVRLSGGPLRADTDVRTQRGCAKRVVGHA
jgi:capsular exopolysaccharide synthesis family protein